MSVLTAFLQKTSSLKSIGVLFILSHLILLSMMMFTFPVIHAQIGVNVFDLQPFGYSLSFAEIIVNNLDESTYQFYLFPQLTFLDVWYPFLLALFLSSALFRFVKRNTPFGNALLVVPFLAMGFDYLENICVILMISKMITLSKSTVLLSSLFTILKGVFTFIAWIALFAYFMNWGLVGMKEKMINNR